MAPPKSKIWNFFSKKSKDYSQCNSCLKVLKSSGNTSNLTAHLKQKHAAIYKAAFVAHKESEENVKSTGREVIISN